MADTPTPDRGEERVPERYDGSTPLPVGFTDADAGIRFNALMALPCDLSFGKTPIIVFAREAETAANREAGAPNHTMLFRGMDAVCSVCHERWPCRAARNKAIDTASEVCNLRDALATEQTMHAAWRKRAEEAERAAVPRAAGAERANWRDDLFVRSWIARLKKRVADTMDRGLAEATGDRAVTSALTWTAFDEFVYALCDHAADSPVAPVQGAEDVTAEDVAWVREQVEAMSHDEAYYRGGIMRIRRILAALSRSGGTPATGLTNPALAELRERANRAYDYLRTHSVEPRENRLVGNPDAWDFAEALCDVVPRYFDAVARCSRAVPEGPETHPEVREGEGAEVAWVVVRDSKQGLEYWTGDPRNRFSPFADMAERFSDKKEAEWIVKHSAFFRAIGSRDWRVEEHMWCDRSIP